MTVAVAAGAASVQIELTGLDALFAIKRRLQVPNRLITGARAAERSAVPYREGTWLRAPGTHLPGLIRHGSYGRSPNREFWAVYRQSEVLVVDTADWEYVRLVLGVRNPAACARDIRAVLR